MKTNDCSIVQDLLPLYIEDMLRPDTTDFVENHLSDCPVCTAALGDLKTETAAPIPTPDAEEVRRGDKNVLNGLRRHLQLQRIAIALAFIYFFLLFFPWANSDFSGSGIERMAFTVVSIFMAAVLSCRQDELSRNMALVATGMILPAVLFPVCYFMTHYGRTVDYSSGDQLAIVLYPVFWLALLLSFLLTGIALLNIWRKAIPLSTDRDPRQKRVFGLILVIVGCIVLSPILPLASPEKYYSNTLLLFNLILGWPSVYLTSATAFCQVSHKKEAAGTIILALALPAYAAIPFWIQYPPFFFGDYTWQEFEAKNLFHVPFLLLSLILSTIAIYSIWYKLKKTKEDYK